MKKAFNKVLTSTLYFFGISGSENYQIQQREALNLAIDGHFKKAKSRFVKLFEINIFHDMIGDCITVIDQVQDKKISKELAQRLFEGYLLGCDNNWKKAIDIFNEVIKSSVDIQSVFLYYSRGYAFYLDQNYEAAIADLGKVIELDDRYYRAYSIRGHIYAEQQRFDDAIADFNRIEKITGGTADMFLSRGYCYEQVKQYQQAVKDYTEIIRLEPESEVGYSYRGAVNCTILKEYEKAIKDLNQAIAIKSNCKDYTLRATALFNLEKWEESSADFDQVLDIYPNDAYATYHQAEIYEKQGKSKEALAMYKRCLAADHEVKENVIFVKEAIKRLERVN